MTVCHIIKPPLTHITNHCLPHHHLLSNTNHNPYLSFSLFRTNPLRSRHIPQSPRPCPTTTAHAGKPLPVAPSSETSPPLLHQWSATAASSSHVSQPPPPSSAPATHVNSPHTTRSHLPQPCSTPLPPEATTSAPTLVGKSTIAAPLTAYNNHRASLQFASSPRATTVAISSSTTAPSSLAHRTTTATPRQPALYNTFATSLQLVGVRERHLLRASRCLNHHYRTSLTTIHYVDHAHSRAIVDIHRNKNK
ncbi:mucin-7-like [Vigna unguiculata]|uniref:mucin-7-like n=1 Tax=Vigna unguiculata TaxID=3917 RepID=UPI0010161C53|nr:mucin-7-like [Vigna unguiculata]